MATKTNPIEKIIKFKFRPNCKLPGPSDLAKTARSDKVMIRFSIPQQTLKREGGMNCTYRCKNGIQQSFPDIPFTKCGTELAQKAPIKNNKILIMIFLHKLIHYIFIASHAIENASVRSCSLILISLFSSALISCVRGART